ncbi:sigma-70 family RNA polymerase sigma factor [Microbacterium sp. SSM24]|uniref:sigma-70 family RNA polymerase sigma factor n=1 Tax=Microbacterium sp. SSM24 TaxID=2991714 RepID=UPI002225F662|nr:sigma-70 family RNA polymerase sigma factor [Microbacterium sp. SSM24]MCW3492919.1 sigma-70 family RNA polymerase sigma factor [Microbacterium sp. SSM24]
MTTVTVGHASDLSDAALVDATRAGDNSAYAELWARHSGAARRAARAITGSIDPDDLVSEAFTNTYSAIRNGAGPRDGFRPYLYAAVRNAAATWGGRQKDIPIDFIEDLPNEGPDHEEQLSDRTLLISAFRALPDSHRTVLWYLEVEGMKPREIAPLLGLSANGVSALAVRARDGFRHAWLDAHIADPGRPADCRWVCEKLVRRKRRPVSRPDRPRFDEHLRRCPGCAIVAREVDHASSKLRAVLLPLVLGGAGAAAFTTLDGGTGASAALLSAKAPPSAVGIGLATVGGLSLVLGAIIAVSAPWEAAPIAAPGAVVEAVRPPAAETPASVDPVRDVEEERAAPVPLPEVVPAPMPEVQEPTPSVPAPPAGSPRSERPPADPDPQPEPEPEPEFVFDVGTPDTSNPARMALAGTGDPGGTVTLFDELGTVLGEATVGEDGTFALAVLGDQLHQGMRITAQHTDSGGAVESSDPIGPLTFPVPIITTDHLLIWLEQVDADGDAETDDTFPVLEGVSGGLVQVAVDGVVRDHLITLDGTGADDYITDCPLGWREITLRYVDAETGIPGPAATYGAIVWSSGSEGGGIQP